MLIFLLHSFNLRRNDFILKADIDIARDADIQTIPTIAAKLGIEDKYLEQYGKFKAKVDLSITSVIRLLVLDFDGVMTDDRVIVCEDGKESVVCHRGDGLGIEMLKRAGRPETIVISRERNPVVAVRCSKLGLQCCHGVEDKLELLKRECESRGLGADEVAYVGNDLNDLACLKWVGMAIAVGDACPTVKDTCGFVTKAFGGDGAVREIAEWFVDSQRFFR